MAIYMFERYAQKFIVFACYGRFDELLPIVLVSIVIYMFQCDDQKLVFLAFYSHFHELLPTELGFYGDLKR